MIRKIVISLLIISAGGTSAGELAAFRGTDSDGRTAADITAGTPAVVLITTPRVADVGAQMRYLKFVDTELGPEATVAAVDYGDVPANVAKLREGLGFPIIAGEGAPPEGTFGKEKEPKTSVVLLLDERGNLRQRLTDIPDPLAAARALGLKYDGGEAGPPSPGQPLPPIILAANRGAPGELRARAQVKPKTLVFLFDAEDEGRGDYLADLQLLADDLGDKLEVVPVMLNATPAVAAKIAESQRLDIPVFVGGPLAARRLVGKLALPALIMAEEHGTVVGVKEKARVPSFNELAAEEAAPATEGEPVALTIKRIMPLTRGLQHDAVPAAAWDASGTHVLYHGHYADGESDHLYEVTAAGGKRRQISYAPAPDIFPATSPDRVHVAFTSARSGGDEIWVCEQVHGEFTQITKSDGNFTSPSFSPDGQWLVAVRNTNTGEGENTDLWYLNGRGRRARPVAETFDDEAEPAFAADGDGVFYAARRGAEWDIFTSDLKGGKKKRLTDAGPEDRMPAPSPDGKYVVYASRKGDEPYKLWAMNVDGSSKVPVTTGAGNDLYPRFDAGGNALVFTSDRSGSFEIYKMSFEPTPDYDLPRPPRPLAGAGGTQGES